MRAARGFTLIELMVSLAIMLIIISGAMSILITSSKGQRQNFDRADVQKSARNALLVMSAELSNAGLGLPRALAFRAFDNPGVVDTSCEDASPSVPMPELTIAALDYLREWSVSALADDSITLASGTPNGATDVAFNANEWFFLYKSPYLAGASSGHGMVQLGASRAAAGTTLSVGSTNFSTAQPSLTLTNANLAPAGEGHPAVLLHARISRFGVDCSDSDHPFLYWSVNGGAPLPLARNVDTSNTGLRFRFLVDADADGAPDDQDGSGVVDDGDLIAAPADLSTVRAVEILLQVRSESADTNTGVYKTERVRQLVALPNLNTRAPGYVFIDNSGI